MIRSATTIKRIVGGVLLAIAAASGTAHAAGLGKLSVNSALGQPLAAEIELTSLQPGEFEALSARVASPDAYREARIEYGSSLRLLRFSVDRRPNGTPILRLTTVAPINEPFLDVLVELNWPAGRLLREYPILLDPPGFNEARPPAAAAAASAPATPQVATVSPAKPVEPSKPSVSASAPAASGKSAPSDTYTVVKGDTLNKIASEVKPDSVSLEQMLVALYRENQAAFIDKNMNLMKSGQILRVPTAETVGKITQSEARKEIRVQVENWKNYRESVGSAVASSKPAPAPASQASGKIATATPSVPSAAPGKDVLKLSKAEVPASKGGTAVSKGAQDQINALKEEAIAREGALKEAQSRVSELEKQIADMRKLMELKGITPPGKGGAKPEPAKPAESKVAKAEPAKVEPAKVEPAKVEPVKAAEAPKVVDAGKAAAKPGDAPVPAQPTDAAKPPEPPKDAAPKADKPKPAPKKAPPPPPPEPTIMEMVMDNIVYIGGGILGLLAAVGGFLFIRKRKSNAESRGPFTSSASSILPSDLKPPTTSGGKAAGGLIDTGNSSFLTDFDKQGPGTIDTDEVDPVAEAEVYIAYGRDAQAEEILKEAMARDRSRHEITLKLLEIYHTRKSAQAFETLAREFKDTVGETSPSWARAAAMGAQLDPSNPLYAGFATQDFGSTATLAASAAPAADPAKPDLDFDLGFSDSAKPSVDVSLDTPSTQPDVDLGFDLNLSGPDSAAPAAESSGAIDLGGGSGLDFDLGLDKTEINPNVSPAPSAAPAAEAPKSDSSFDFDLSSLSLDSSEDKTMPASAAAPVTTPEMEKTAAFNLGDISLDLGSPAESAPPAASGGGGDASSTKLELARAYVEIGDKDGAKEILQEVLREGSAAQKQEAQSLLSSL